jgi:phenylalanyl-tRNA synthetase beta chain
LRVVFENNKNTNDMNISYNWLKEYVDFNLTPDEVAAALTSIGLETGGVEEMQTIKGGLEGLVIGEVLTCEEHPNSDHLHVTTVNLGSGEPSQIVCGAANVAAGQKVVVATLGTVLYSGEESFTIKKSKIRGVESNGMICAEDEIGIGTSHDGIIVLPADAVPVHWPKTITTSKATMCSKWISPPTGPMPALITVWLEICTLTC